MGKEGSIVPVDNKTEIIENNIENINKAMKRNIARFPKDFCFQLNENEIENLRFQFGTSSLEKENYGGRRYLPYVYTEQGIAMLCRNIKK